MDKFYYTDHRTVHYMQRSVTIYVIGITSVVTRHYIYCHEALHRLLQVKRERERIPVAIDTGRVA